MADFLTEYVDDLLGIMNAEKVAKTGNTVYSFEDDNYLAAKLIGAFAAEGKSVIYSSANAARAKKVYENLPDGVKKRTRIKDVDAESAMYEIKNLKEKGGAVLPAKDIPRFIKDRAAAKRELCAYYAEMYESEIADDNYYGVLDRLIGSSLPSVNFTDASKAALTRKKYSAVKENVRAACGHFAVMAGGGKVSECPWYGANNPKKTDEILRRFSALCRVMENVLGCLDRAPDNLTLVNVIAALADNVLEKEEMRRLLNLEKFPCGYEKLEGLINAFNAVYFDENAQYDVEGSENEKDFESFINCGADESLKYSELKKICENSDIFVRGGKYANGFPLDKLLSLKHKIENLEKEREHNLKEALSVFDRLPPEKGGVVLKAYEKLKSFYADGFGKPKFFDFGAKRAYKKLCAFSSVKSPSFDSVIGATYSYNEAAACRDDIAKLKFYICRMMGRELAEQELESLYLVLNKFEENALTGLELSDYLIKLQRAKTLVKRCAGDRKVPDDFLLGDFANAYKLHLRRLELKAAADEILKAADFGYNGRELPVLACSIALVMRTAELFGNNDSVVEFHEKVRGYDKPFMNDLMFIVNELINIGMTYFKNYYTRNPFALNLGDLKYFVSCAEDRAVADAATGYYNAVFTEKSLPLDKFFEPFINGEISAKPEDMPEIFENSYCKFAVENKRKALGKKRAGFGKHSAAAIDKLYAAETGLSDEISALAAQSGVHGDICYIFPPETADMLASYDTGAGVFLFGKGGDTEECARDTALANDVKRFIISRGVESTRVKTDYTFKGVKASVAVLSGDHSRVALAVWCERPVRDKKEYFDYAVREYGEILKSGVASYRVFIHDWYDNAKNEKAALAAALEKIRF